MTSDKIEIKYIGTEMSGDVYITKLGSYVIDINFNKDDPDLHNMTPNDIDGEPCSRLKADRFKIVNEFTNE